MYFSLTHAGIHARTQHTYVSKREWEKEKKNLSISFYLARCSWNQPQEVSEFSRYLHKEWNQGRFPVTFSLLFSFPLFKYFSYVIQPRRFFSYTLSLPPFPFRPLHFLSFISFPLSKSFPSFSFFHLLSISFSFPYFLSLIQVFSFLSLLIFVVLFFFSYFFFLIQSFYLSLASYICCPFLFLLPSLFPLSVSTSFLLYMAVFLYSSSFHSLHLVLITFLSLPVLQHSFLFPHFYPLSHASLPSAFSFFPFLFPLSATLQCATKLTGRRRKNDRW